MMFPMGGPSTTVAFAIGQISGFLLFLYLLTTVFLAKLIPKTRARRIKRKNSDMEISRQGATKRNELRVIVIIVGLSITFLNALPLLSTPYAIQNAENEFTEAYGEHWRDNIPADVESFFMPSQFNIYNYFVGLPHPDCNVDQDIQYFSEGNDFYLTFDVYYPKKFDRELPGHNSTIIKIHGGGWTEGDKSEFNMLWVNKYLASQGYIVFDIQYGLLDTGEPVTIPTPDHVRGDFTLHDMIFQIGYFTKQLESTLADKYQANLDSVFIMGNSAGGHLTGVVGLGYNDPYFAGNFSTALTIKGIIPIYPANDAKNFVSKYREGLLEGDPDSDPLEFEKFTPSELADEDDPAALIFHGMQDGLVPIKESKDIEEALEDEGVDCILLRFPFAAHANDFIASNNFSQVWIYYLERFLYLQQ